MTGEAMAVLLAAAAAPSLALLWRRRGRHGRGWRGRGWHGQRTGPRPRAGHGLSGALASMGRGALTASPFAAGSRSFTALPPPPPPPRVQGRRSVWSPQASRAAANAAGSYAATAARLGMVHLAASPSAWASAATATFAPPWLELVLDAGAARDRFVELTRATGPSPVSSRLLELRHRVDAAADAAWQVAHRGQAMHAALGALGPERVRERADRFEAELRAEPHRADLEAACRALRSQLATIDRFAGSVRRTHDQLVLVVAGLGEAVAHATELSFRAAPEELGTVADHLDAVVDRLEGLRRALDEIEGAVTLS